MECTRYARMTWLRLLTTGICGWSGQLTVILTLSVAAVVGQDDEADLLRQPGGLHYAVPEELHVGTQVANIVVDAGLQKHGVEALRQMRFRLLNQPTGGFVIGNTTGVLTVGSRLDREQLCPGLDDSCLIRLDVAVQPMSYFQIIKVYIEVVDINDNDPYFEPDIRTIQLSELSVPGTAVLLPATHDADTSANSVTSYHLSATELFSLTMSSKLDGSTDVKLVLVRALDREETDTHRLVVTAFDGGEPRRSGTLNLIVKVLDANDNRPIFERDRYEVEVMENSAVGTRLTTVHAFDADVGDNAFIVYQFATTTIHSFPDTFHIDNATGAISVAGTVDYEAHPVYQLMVTATDCGSPERLSADAIVVVRVGDSNDNSPLIRINTLRAADTDVATVPEDAPPETFVAHVIVRDADSGDDGEFTCLLSPPSVGDRFRLRATHDGEFQVVTSDKPLDRELVDSYDVELVCTDHGQQALVSVRQLTIDVIDVNDVSPRFDQAVYVADVLENNFVGAFVVQLNATDADSGENGRIVYSIVNEGGDRGGEVFEVDPDTGTVTASAVLDREVMSRYKMRVRAVDCGRPTPLTGTAILVVNVIDIDDELPQFLSATYFFQVAENQPSGTEVGRLLAIDADSPTHGHFYFRLKQTNGEDDVETFIIDRQTGAIITTKPLDREQKTAYVLVAEVFEMKYADDVDHDDESVSRHSASSLAVGKLNSTALVNVQVLDVNDNKPVFVLRQPKVYSETGNGAEAVMTVSNVARKGNVVATLTAIDDDDGNNALVTYSIVAGNDRKLFHIDAESGDIIADIDFLGDRDNQVVNLRVVAADCGHPMLSTTLNLLLVVNHTVADDDADDIHSYGGGDGTAVDGSRRGADSDPANVVLVGAACGSGLVMFTAILTAVVFALRSQHRRRHRDTSNDCCCCCCCCEGNSHEVADSDHSGSKEVKERRARTTSTVYTVDASEKTSMNGLAVNYCDDQSPLSTLDVTGRRKKTSAAAAVAAWRSCSTVQSDIDARSPPSPRPANNECLRRPETSSAAEVVRLLPRVQVDRVTDVPRSQSTPTNDCTTCQLRTDMNDVGDAVVSVTRPVVNGGLSLTSRRIHPPPPPPPPPPGSMSASSGLGSTPRITTSYCQYHCFATVGRRHQDKPVATDTHHNHNQQQQLQYPVKHDQRRTNSVCSSLV